ncbi:Hypothetical protein D9617_11g008330 [Elsinoe fawcettii]|nr:Hypothetical protein D9617_11g008330 [Elsinoe fawcettii]
MVTSFSLPSLGQVRHALVAYISLLVRAALNISLVYLLVNYWSSAAWGFPLFAESIVQIICSEINIFKQRKRERKADEALEDGIDLDEKLEEGKSKTDISCVTSVVGYREDEIIWRKCLESYRDNYDGVVRAVCMGIDGNEVEDLAMVQTAEDVFGVELTIVDLDETFGALAGKASARLPSSPQDSPILGPISEKRPFVVDTPEQESIVTALVSKATAILEAHGSLYTSSTGPVRPICITQPHHSKKEIMFTAFIFSIAIAQANDISFLWSTDSDSWVYPGTLSTAIKSIYADERIGGTATRFSIHNSRESTIAYLAAATYEADFALQIGLLSACETTDCQPGPCALFRLSALEEAVLPWYQQNIFGFRPKLVNDDRHLTTRLLLAGHRITSNPLITTATDTPVTIPRYIVQQIRWARASFVEGTCYPRIFLLHHPLLCLATFRRFYIPALNILIVTRYLLIGEGSGFSSLADIGARLALASLYSSCRVGRGIRDMPVHAASMLLFQVPQSAFQVWAGLSMFENQWGTTGRSQAEKQRGLGLWWLVGQAGPLGVVGVWLVMVAGALGRWVAGRVVEDGEMWGVLVGAVVMGAGYVGAIARGG